MHVYLLSRYWLYVSIAFSQIALYCNSDVTRDISASGQEQSRTINFIQINWSCRQCARGRYPTRPAPVTVVFCNSYISCKYCLIKLNIQISTILLNVLVTIHQKISLTSLAQSDPTFIYYYYYYYVNVLKVPYEK